MNEEGEAIRLFAGKPDERGKRYLGIPIVIDPRLAAIASARGKRSYVRSKKVKKSNSKSIRSATKRAAKPRKAS